MNQRKLGRTSLPVSELCLGAMQFGSATDQETSLAILDAYRDVGGNFVQTATCGPSASGPGSCPSEEIVGAWLQENPGARDGMILSTRMSFPSSNHRFGGGLAESVRQRCETSLRRLNTTHLDLLVCDWNDTILPLDDIFSAISDLVRAGKLRYVGAAGFPVWRFMEALGRSAHLGGCRFESFQADYSLLERAPFEPDALELAHDYRVALLAQSPLAGGFLTGSHELSQKAELAHTRLLRARYGNARGHAVLDVLADVGAEFGVTPGQVALAWVLARDAVTAPVLGFLTPVQLHDATAATCLVLGTEHLARLDAASRRLPIPRAQSVPETVTH